MTPFSATPRASVYNRQMSYKQDVKCRERKDTRESVSHKLRLHLVPCTVQELFCKLCGLNVQSHKPHFRQKSVALQYVHNESHDTSSTLISALWKCETAMGV